MSSPNQTFRSKKCLDLLPSSDLSLHSRSPVSVLLPRVFPLLCFAFIIHRYVNSAPCVAVSARLPPLAPLFTPLTLCSHESARRSCRSALVARLVFVLSCPRLAIFLVWSPSVSALRASRFPVPFLSPTIFLIASIRKALLSPVEGIQ